MAVFKYTAYPSAPPSKHYLQRTPASPRKPFSNRPSLLPEEDSKEGHEEYVRKELRRKDAIYYSPDFNGAEKMLLVLLSSPQLGFQGIVDLIVKTGDSEYIPVDYKNMASDHGRAWMDHKYQLTAYALLVDDQFRTRVRRGFINYIPEDLILELEITSL